MALDPTSTLPRSPGSQPLRVAFFGSPALAIPTLDALLARPDLCEVVAVVAQPDKPVGRGRKMRPPPVAARATDAGIRLLQPRRLRRGPFPEALESLDLDLAVVIAYGRILTTRILETPRFGCINVHASLLPAYRGAGPIQWAIIRGEERTGVCTMWMEEGLDTGPVLQVREEPIRADDTAGTLGDRLARLGASLLIETVEELAAGRLTATTQAGEGVSLAPLLSKEDGRLDWRRPAVVLDRLVRGTAPWPGAWCGFRGKTLKVHAASPVPDEPDVPPGTIVSATDHGLLVRCSAGSLLVERVQPPGKRAMDAGEFLRGYRAAAGESLAAPEE